MELVQVEYKGQEVKIKNIEFGIIEFIDQLNHLVRETWTEFLLGLNSIDAIVFARHIISEYEANKIGGAR